jgi:hypothetical protein
MISARYPQITDEMLSAYIDKAVTEEERLLIETAVADEPTVAWRLETLRQTVQLLRALPEVALTRSFTLHELPAAVGQEGIVIAPPVGQHRLRPVVPRPGTRWAALREALSSIWQMGSPLLRNAAAASFALFLVLLIGDIAVTTPRPLASATAARAVLTESAPTVAVTSAQPAAKVPVATTTAPSPTVAPGVVNEQANNSAPSLASSSQMASAPADRSAGEGFEAAQAAAPPGTTEVNPGNRAPGPDETMSVLRDSTADQGEPTVAESMAAVVSEQKTTTTAQTASATYYSQAVPMGAAGQVTTSAVVTTEDGVAPAVSAPGAAVVAPNVAGATATTGGAVTPTATLTPVQVPTLTEPLGNGEATAKPWLSTLQLAQAAAGFLTLLFAVLWWRSRATVVDA